MTQVQVIQEGGKGGGGGGAVSRTYRYFAHVAVAIGEGTIENVKRIWANSNLLYVKHDGPTTKTETGILAVDRLDIYPYKMKVWTDDEDFGRPFTSGGITDAPVTISGFTNPENNGSFILFEEWLGGDGPFPNTSGQGSYFILNNVNAVTEAAAGQTVTMSQLEPDFLETQVEDIRVYKGDQTTVDSLIESFEDDDGTGIPAFKGTAYVVFQKIALADYGNSIPNFNFEVMKDGDHILLGDAIDRVIARVKDKDDARAIPASEVDTTGVGNIGLDKVHGYATAGPVSAVRQLEPLMLFGEVRLREVAGQMIFWTGDGPSVTIEEDDLACHAFQNSEVPPKISLTDRAGFDLPSEVNVTFRRAGARYPTESQRFRRIEATTGHTADIRLPVFLSRGQAQRMAKRRLWTAWEERQHASFTLPPKYLEITEGDHLTVPVRGESYEIRVQEVSRGNDFLMEVKGVLVGSSTTDQEDTTVDDPPPDIDEENNPGAIPQVQLLVLNTAPLREDHVEIPGFYWAIAAISPQAPWPGATIFRAKDDVDFAALASTENEATMGVTLTTLGDVEDVRGIFYWDRKNTLDVYVFNGTLTSRSEQEVLNGRNRMWVYTDGGGEIIGFQNATLIGTNQYRLDTLLRGIRDTENETGGHATGDNWLLLSQFWTTFQPIDVADIGSTHYFKGVATNGVEADITSQSSVVLGKSIGAFGVIHVEGSRDDDNNLTVSWTRRTRALVDPFAGEGTPLLFDQEQYKLEVLDAPGGNIVRWIVVDDDTSIEYLAVEQTQDGLTPGDPVNLRLWQVSSITGKGTLKTATV